MDTRSRYGTGKSLELDAKHLAVAALGLPLGKLRRPRWNDSVRLALRFPVTSRKAMSTERTQAVNALTALLRTNELGFDARGALSGTKIVQVSLWSARDEEPSLSIACTKAVHLAQRILELDDQLKTNDKRLTELMKISEAEPLVQEKGFGPVTAAECLTTWSHHGPIRNEAAYASLAGAKPIPASSGNVIHNRLNRERDRILNSGLHMVALTKMTHDAQT